MRADQKYQRESAINSANGFLFTQKQEHKTSSDWLIVLACAQLVNELASDLC